MQIFVTDDGQLWNHENPVLEKYAECVVVICLNGKAVTEKYRCIVSPFQAVGLGMTDYGTASYKFQALTSIKKELSSCFSYHEDIVFLADNSPESLYPYMLLKDVCNENRMHLWCMSPLKFERRKRSDSYFEMLKSIDKLTSLFYLDPNELLFSMHKKMTYPEFITYCRDFLNSLLPAALFEIDSMMEYAEKYFYDLNSRRYISTRNSYESLLEAEPVNRMDANDFKPYKSLSTMGLMMAYDYPSTDIGTQEIVEQLYPRYDGKKICEQLKIMRKQLADENGIPYEPIYCPSTGPCAGTCEQCDREMAYLMSELEKIPSNMRKYPKHSVEEMPVTMINSNSNAMMGLLALRWNVTRN